MTDEQCREQAIETVLSNPEDMKGRHKQIQAKLLDEPREDVGRFCVYLCQMKNLNLRPWELCPLYSDGEDNGPAARLVRRLRKAGISQWHPDPLRALKAIGAGNKRTDYSQQPDP